MSKARDLANLGSNTASLATDAEVSSAVAPKADTTTVNAALATKADSSAVIANSLVDAKGDLLTATADNTPARLAVGTNGQVLTADSSTATGVKWATASAGALTLITQASFTAQSTVNVNNCFTSTYDNYLLILDISSPSVSSLLLSMRLRASGTDASGANYARSYIANAFNNSAVVSGTGVSETEWWGLGLGNGGNTMVNLVVDLRKPALATRTFMNARYTKGDSGGSDTGILGGFHWVNTAYDGFTLFTSTGTVNGSYKVYGYQNS